MQTFKAYINESTNSIQIEILKASGIPKLYMGDFIEHYGKLLRKLVNLIENKKIPIERAIEFVKQILIKKEKHEHIS